MNAHRNRTFVVNSIYGDDSPSPTSPLFSRNRVRRGICVRVANCAIFSPDWQSQGLPVAFHTCTSFYHLPSSSSPSVFSVTASFGMAQTYSDINLPLPPRSLFSPLNLPQLPNPTVARLTRLAKTPGGHHSSALAVCALKWLPFNSLSHFNIRGGKSFVAICGPASLNNYRESQTYIEDTQIRFLGNKPRLKKMRTVGQYTYRS